MRDNIQKFFLAVVIYVAICILATTVLKPFSIVNFVGPAAAAASALIVMWGGWSLLSVIFGTVIFIAYLNYFTGHDVELSIILISLLAITLQSLWAKQLTYHYVGHQKWLNSRSLLFAFLIKIGPVAGIVSASTTVLVALLDAKILAGALGYAFFSGWAGSILVAIFLTPTLLFTKGEQKLTLSKRTFIIIASILSCVAIGFLFIISQKSHQHQRFDVFNDAKIKLLRGIDDNVSAVSAQVNALSALFSASESVTKSDFNVFSKQISGNNTTVKALHWLPFVENSKRVEFEQAVSSELSLPFVIVEQSLLGDVKISQKRRLYLPSVYMYPDKSNSTVLGLDLYNHLETSFAINQAAELDKIVASPPLNLYNDGISAPKVYVFHPVYKSNGLNKFGEKHVNERVISGYILALIQFDSLFNEVELNLKLDKVSFSINDVSRSAPYFVFGDNNGAYNTLYERIEVDVFTRKWQIDIFENQRWSVQSKTWQTWSLLIGGTLGGMFFQVLILMMAAYSTELSNQVSIKTRELISSKEKSDKENNTKSQFLATLAVEFTSSISLLSEIVTNYNNKDKSKDDSDAQHFLGIDNAVQSLKYLVSNLNDLNSIESGKLAINNQTLNLHRFINKMETRLKTTAEIREQSIVILMGKNVPQFVEADENRLQQLLTTVTENAFLLLNSDEIRLTIKAHLHKLASTSVFFVFTVNNSHFSDKNSQLFNPEKNEELEVYNTAMTMVKELCVLLGGDAKMITLPSGDSMISLSINVALSSHEFPQKVAVKPRVSIESLVSRIENKTK